MERLSPGVRDGSDSGSTAPWLVLGVLFVVPVLVLGAWWVVADADNPTRAAAPVDAVVAPVTRQDVRAETSVAVKVGDAPGRDVGVGASGTVTVAAVPRTVLDNGVEVLRVDDRPLRAMVATAPPWRSLAAGDKGPDVVRLQEFLTTTGYYRGKLDGVFSTAVRVAVEKFNVAAGLGKGVGSFDPATVVWVGPQALTVAEVLAPEGAAVSPGSPVLRGPARHDVIAVTEPQGGIRTVGEFGEQAKLVVGSAAVAYAPGSGAVSDPAAVEAVRAALAPAMDGTAQVRAAAALPVAVVPASALVQGPDGTLCLYASPDASPVVVAPVGGGVGSVQLPADLALDHVLANPGRVALGTPCGS
ncbi:peptidoglycan-binding domain-containing protein [Cellulomonas sp. URHB0016]